MTGAANNLSFTFGEKTTHIIFANLSALTRPDSLGLASDAVWIADENTRRFAPKDAVVLSAGESTKRWDVAHRLLTELLERGVERRGTVVGVGGGVICDLVAFVASLYARGIGLVLIPTSLLAMVDAALGGKTGIDFGGYENMVGTFYPAERLLIAPEAVATLPAREYKSGLAETIKTALLGDEELLMLLEEHREAVMAREPDVVEVMVSRCLAVKGSIASADFREGSGLATNPGSPVSGTTHPVELSSTAPASTVHAGLGRAALNLGHTFGHALEAITAMNRFTHGEAVAWGIYRATLVSHSQGRCSEEYLRRIGDLLAAYGFELAIPGLDADALIGAMYRDKKTAAGALRFVLQEGPGRQELVTLTETEIRRVLA